MSDSLLKPEMLAEDRLAICAVLSAAICNVESFATCAAVNKAISSVGNAETAWLERPAIALILSLEIWAVVRASIEALDIAASCPEVSDAIWALLSRSITPLPSTALMSKEPICFASRANNWSLVRAVN